MTLRTKVTLKNGEAAVVFDVDTWNYLVWVFTELAMQHPEYSDERDSWLATAEHVIKWVDKTSYFENVIEDEDDNWQ
jgi:hypothetical protein